MVLDDRAAVFGRTDVQAVFAHLDARDTAIAVAARLYGVPAIAIGRARPAATQWSPELCDAWDLAAWLLWRWTPVPPWAAVDIDGSKLGDLLEGCMRVKAGLTDPAIFNFVAGAEIAMRQEAHRPPARSGESLPHSSACREWTADAGRPAFFLPTHTTAGAS